MKEPSVEEQIDKIDYTEKLTELGTLLRDIFEEGTYYNKRKELCIKGCEDDLIVPIINLFSTQQAQMRDKIKGLYKHDSFVKAKKGYIYEQAITDVLAIIEGEK